MGSSEVPHDDPVSEDGVLFLVDYDFGREVSRRRIGSIEGTAYGHSTLRNARGDVIVAWEQFESKRYEQVEMNGRAVLEPGEVDEGCLRYMVYQPYELWVAVLREGQEPAVSFITGPHP